MYDNRNSQLATRNSQLATRNSQLATRNSQLATKNARLKLAVKHKFHTPCENTGSNNTREIPRQARDVARRAIKKLGFTLVELAIGIVIIGLLIAGILAGQSLISSAQINAAASQIQQYDAGVMSFKSKYKYMPGDAPAFGNYGGDGDGVLSLGNCCGFATEIFGNEMINFWHNLKPDEFTGCNNVTACGGMGQQIITSGSNKAVPLSKIGKAGSFFMATAASTAFTSGVLAVADRSNIRNYYYILDPSQGQTPTVATYYGASTTTSSNSAVKPADLLSIDQKIDDGIANSGNVMSGRTIACGGGGGACIYPAGLATCSSGATYTVTNSGFECTPLIRIGAQVGQPQ